MPGFELNIFGPGLPSKGTNPPPGPPGISRNAPVSLCFFKKNVLLPVPVPVEHRDVGGQIEGVDFHSCQVSARKVQLFRIPGWVQHEAITKREKKSGQCFEIFKMIQRSSPEKGVVFIMNRE